LSVTVVPADHLEWQPPHMIAVRVSWSPLLIAKMREPESSIGAKVAPHTPQRCSSSDRVRFREMVTLGIRHRSRVIGYTRLRMTTDSRPDWPAIERMPEFRALVRAKRAFLLPACVFFVAYYFALPALVGYWPDLMSTPVIGRINLGYLFALSQFVMAWALMAAYVRRARQFDRMAAELLQRVDGVPRSGGRK
jgi:uncharacterized membrane protein (DUF485 family)